MTDGHGTKRLRHPGQKLNISIELSKFDNDRNRIWMQQLAGGNSDSDTVGLCDD